MTTYVALLRGINVGGKCAVAMPTLREVFEGLGCGDVGTYINSGNVVLRDSRASAELAEAAEAAIEERFGFPVPVLIRDLATIRRLTDAIPATWTNDGEQRTDVLFLAPDVDEPGLLESIKVNPEVENVMHAHGALVWNVSRSNVNRSNLRRLAGTELYRRLSIRNMNTVRKLRELMEAAGG